MLFMGERVLQIRVLVPGWVYAILLALAAIAKPPQRRDAWPCQK